MARRRFRRRRIFRAGPIFKFLLLLGGVWLAGFFAFTGWVFSLAPPAPMPHAGGIVALTGGDDRVGAALALLTAHDAPLLLISGVGRYTYLGDFTPDGAAATTHYAGNITLGHSASSTHTNATEAAAWAQAHHLHSLIIVTADYHMPRALLELQAALPGVLLIAAPVRPPAIDQPGWATVKLLAEEYNKYLVVRAGFGGVAAQFAAP
jgi:uncharacterized SAM-binding protein YcdF (DUF218 family)